MRKNFFIKPDRQSEQASEGLSGLEDSAVVNYLLKDDNFKRIYFKMKEVSMPPFIRSSQEVSRIGIPLTGDAETDAMIRFRDIKNYDIQTLNNMMDILPCFYEYCLQSNLQRWTNYTMLDIGSRTGVGTNLLGQLFADHYWAFGLQLTVDALDIDTEWDDYSKTNAYIHSLLHQNLFDLEDNSYDFCLCSHTIEHLEDPVEFVRKATLVARKFAIFYCPYEEYDPSPTSGHRPIDDKIISQCNPVFRKLIKSVNRKREDLYFVCFITSQLSEV